MESIPARMFVFRKPNSLHTHGLPTRSPEKSPEEAVAAQWEEACVNAPVVLIKTIRLSVDEALLLARRDPGIKVLVLVRDPRATVVSLVQSPSPWAADMTDVGNICTKLVNSARVAGEQAVMGEKSMMLIRYANRQQALLH